MQRKYERKLKQPKAAWTRAFPSQAAALHPERGAPGGVKARGASEAVRMAVYGPIAAMFKAARWKCEACIRVAEFWLPESEWPLMVRDTKHVHHSKGRVGLLLFDTRYWVPVCEECHRWIGDNVEKARGLGLIAAEGDWGRQDAA